MSDFLRIYFLLFSVFSIAQTDFSNRWEDFYSYNNVKDFVVVDNEIYALSDNAVFVYNLSTKETQKLSSIRGFSGEPTSAIHYSRATNKLVIGYQNGLIEVLDKEGNITISADIVSFNQSGEKSINAIVEFNSKLYISTPFAVVVYDIAKLEFGDTYFIGAASTAEKINEILIDNNQLYAATQNGVYKADLSNPNLIDFNNWIQLFSGNFTNIVSFNSTIYASKGNEILKITNASFSVEKSLPTTILDLKSTAQYFLATMQKSAIVYNNSLNQVLQSNPSSNYLYTLNTAAVLNNSLYLGTKEYGVLTATFNNLQSFTEIHPDGPLSNSVFSISTLNNNAWFVYGGYDAAYVPVGIGQGFSHYNGEKWLNTAFNPSFPFLDLVDVTIDPKNNNRLFISSFAQTTNGNIYSGGGLIEVVDDKIIEFYSSQNSPLEDFVPTNPNYITTRISGSVFDSQDNLWVTDALGKNKLKKLSPGKTWQSFDLSSLQTNKAQELNNIIVDNANTVWIGTRRNGVYAFNENGSRMRALTTEPTKGNLPHANVRTLVADKNNRIWLGTQSGLVVFNNASGVFDATIYDASPIIILDDGIPKKLLGDQTINTIAVDGADNKWFGTENGGVLYTNPSGQKTLASFNKDNSPLPSNKILKISVDVSNGKVFFATDKGVVAYNSKVASFGDALGEVYAYPNPALKNHQKITIDGRNGAHLPKGTNVKILDVSGNLVYETNVVEGQEVQGGKVVWNKTNLAGRKVVSGIYIVLLSNDDATETSSTKIAIIN